MLVSIQLCKEQGLKDRRVQNNVDKIWGRGGLGNVPLSQTVFTFQIVTRVGAENRSISVFLAAMVTRKGG